MVVCEDSQIPIAAAAARVAAATAPLETASLGTGLAPMAAPPACAIASPATTARTPIEMSFLRLIDMMGGVADGTRTHDNRNHNPGLYR